MLRVYLDNPRSQADILRLFEIHRRFPAVEYQGAASFGIHGYRFTGPRRELLAFRVALDTDSWHEWFQSELTYEQEAAA